MVIGVHKARYLFYSANAVEIGNGTVQVLPDQTVVLSPESPNWNGPYAVRLVYDTNDGCWYGKDQKATVREAVVFPSGVIRGEWVEDGQSHEFKCDLLD